MFERYTYRTQNMKEPITMKIRLRNALMSKVNPLFFALTCLLLATVMFSAKMIADQVSRGEDAGLFRFEISHRYPRLERN